MNWPLQLKDVQVPREDTPIDLGFFNNRFKLFVNAIGSVSDRIDAFGEVSDTLIATGLARLNSALGPMLTKVTQAADQGFLVARSQTDNLLVQSATAGWIITADGGKDFFTPTPYLLAIDNGNIDNWAIIHLTSYDRVSGTLQATVSYIHSWVPGPWHSADWTISVNAATIPVMQDMIVAAQTARDGAQTANGSAQAALLTVSSAVATIAALAGSSAVVSVAGKAGVVDLVVADIGGLTDALATKAAISYVQGLVAPLASLASPAFTGNPTAPTPALSDSSNRLATTAFVAAVIASLSGVITLIKSTPTQAQAGTDDSTYMTPLTTKAALSTLQVDTTTVLGLTAALAAKAPLASPALSGTPTAPTPLTGDASTRIATSAFVATALANLVGSAPGALDTLNELAAALGNDPNFAATLTSSLSTKQPLDATLTALAAMTTAANQLIYATGPDAFATTVLSAFMRTLLDDPDQGTARATLGLGSAATQNSNAFDPAGAAAAVQVIKASSATIAAGLDDTQFATAAGIAAVYSPKTLAWAAAQAAGFTLGAAFNGKAIPWTAAGAGTITLANDAPAGTECLIVCEDVGQITFAAQSGGSVASRGTRLKSNGVYSMITAIVRSNSGTNAAWRLGGDLIT